MEENKIINSATAIITHVEAPSKIKAPTAKQLEVVTSSDSAIETLNKVGATVEKACRVLNDMLGATTLQNTLDYDGDKVAELVPDHKVRHLGALTILEIHKVIKDKSVGNVTAVFNDVNVLDDAKRVLSLPRVKL